LERGTETFFLCPSATFTTDCISACSSTSIKSIYQELALSGLSVGVHKTINRTAGIIHHTLHLALVN